MDKQKFISHAAAAASGRECSRSTDDAAAARAIALANGPIYRA